ncbi:universal stress protein [Sinorhizobium sp. BG8]|uniref:universal stress protein n=1 Tax=Sinorhizobium sp. BG8 TaxID=2613773 RepID=UPI00193C9800|nr:universal stress protein [Sinorhizobium sp. BG8]QRM53220.1 universal stress protein [Sinorhizobium sp. BG8]
MYKHILIPIDGSNLSAMAVEQGLALAKQVGARVTFMMVIEPFHILTADSDQLGSTRDVYEAHAHSVAAGHLASAAEKARALGVDCVTLQVDANEAYRAIIDTAGAKGCDLIAMASHGRRGIDALLLGSVTTKVLTHSKVPVLVYR